jgi:hypothetical protein
MRKSMAVLLLAGMVAGTQGRSRGDDPAEARALVARAIRAAGGEATLARYKARTWNEKATYYGAGGSEQYEATYAAAWPDKLRVEIDSFTMVLNGEKAWVKVNGSTRAATPQELEEHREGTYSVWVMSLLPLADGEFKLSGLGERKVGGRPADGVKVGRKGHFDIGLYFDRETGLLAMSETRFKEARSGKEVHQETVFGGYKDVSGTKCPTKATITRDGKKCVEASLECKPVERLDDRVFARP